MTHRSLLDVQIREKSESGFPSVAMEIKLGPNAFHDSQDLFITFHKKISRLLLSIKSIESNIASLESSFRNLSGFDYNLFFFRMETITQVELAHRTYFSRAVPMSSCLVTISLFKSVMVAYFGFRWGFERKKSHGSVWVWSPKICPSFREKIHYSHGGKSEGVVYYKLIHDQSET